MPVLHRHNWQRECFKKINNNSENTADSCWGKVHELKKETTEHSVYSGRSRDNGVTGEQCQLQRIL